jgi:hypothetical protein
MLSPALYAALHHLASVDAPAVDLKTLDPSMYSSRELLVLRKARHLLDCLLPADVAVVAEDGCSETLWGRKLGGAVLQVSTLYDQISGSNAKGECPINYQGRGRILRFFGSHVERTYGRDDDLP